jgi:acetylornithine deacetylase/succinyl-diaminopimelate desuccinylase-like protein
MSTEAVDLLSRYIRLDTSNPPGNEHLAADFFARILKDEGINFKVYESKPGRQSIRAKSGFGQRNRSFSFIIQIDAAGKDEWSFDPFGGEIIDGYICGRGALDTKSLGIMQLLSLFEVHRNNVAINRDLVFLATADEESGSDCGVEYLLREHAADFPAGLVLNEGSYVAEGIVPGRLLAMISPGEKGPCWIKLKRKGIPGHGSTPHGNNALERLTQAVNRLTGRVPRVTPVVAGYFRMAPAWNFSSHA